MKCGSRNRPKEHHAEASLDLFRQLRLGHLQNIFTLNRIEESTAAQDRPTFGRLPAGFSGICFRYLFQVCVQVCVPNRDL